MDRIVFSSSAAVYGTPDVELVPESTPRPRVALRRVEAHRRVAAARPGGRAGLRTPPCATSTSSAPATPTSTTPARTTSSRSCSTRCSPGRTPRSTATTTRRPTAPTCATTSTSPTSRSRTSRRRSASTPGSPSSPPTTSAAATALGSARSWTPWRAGTGIDFTPEIAPRRPGDPPRIVAPGELAARDLDWRDAAHARRDGFECVGPARRDGGEKGSGGFPGGGTGLGPRGGARVSPETPIRTGVSRRGS